MKRQRTLDNLVHLRQPLEVLNELPEIVAGDEASWKPSKIVHTMNPPVRRQRYQDGQEDQG